MLARVKLAKKLEPYRVKKPEISTNACALALKFPTCEVSKKSARLIEERPIQRIWQATSLLASLADTQPVHDMKLTVVADTV